MLPEDMVASLVSSADAARDGKRHQAAAALYAEALRIVPDHAGLHIQCGHMHKEIGELAPAERHYLEAQRLTPDDPDLALQLGHFYKVAGRMQASQAAYERAVRLKPGWDEPTRELANLHGSGWRGVREAPADPHEFDLGAVRRPGGEGLGGRSAAELAQLIPKFVPQRPEDLLHSHHEHIEVRRLGRKEVGFWGNRRTLRGVEAIRGFCISSVPLLEVHVLLNGLTIHRGPLRGGYVLQFEREKHVYKKYVFNIWLDFAGFARGLHAIELRFTDAADLVRSVNEEVVIAEPVLETLYPESNTLVSLSAEDPRTVDEQIRSRPSMVRPAKRRALFPEGVRNVLVMRMDQLGDVVASVPALQRLRELLPSSHIVGLFTPANADLARTLDFLDEVLVADFPDVSEQRRRLMSLDAQEDLRRQLAPYAFDIAIDLAQAGLSRELLRLAGAKFTYGTGGEDWPWLSADMNFNTHDRWNGDDMTPHSAKVLTLIEGLGTLLKPNAPIIRRPELSREMLKAFGVTSDEHYAVLHSGARVGFTRWPHYAEVAISILAQTDMKVVMMSEDANAREALPADLLAHERFVFLGQRLPFDVFDAFISFATVMAANDSGPKHLAALRGTNVVAVFPARNNWQEWGQENVGMIVSRRVPCAGCAIYHDGEECGKDYACIMDIKPQEVVEAMLALVDQSDRVLA